MALYKDQQGNIHDDMDGTATHLLPPGCVPMTSADVAIQYQQKMAEEKASMLEIGRAMREIVINRLDGISSRSQRAGDTATSAACDATIVELLGITSWPDVVAATDGPSTKVAFLARYNQIATELAAASPYAYTAFR